MIPGINARAGYGDCSLAGGWSRGTQPAPSGAGSRMRGENNRGIVAGSPGHGMPGLVVCGMEFRGEEQSFHTIPQTVLARGA